MLIRADDGRANDAKNGGFFTNRGIPHRVSIQDSSGWMVDAVAGHMKYIWVWINTY